MGPLGFYSICLKTTDLDETVGYYRRLGFVPTGEDAPGLRISLANGEDALTFMSFLDANLVNFRGAHIHRLMSELQAAGIGIADYNVRPDQQPLMLDGRGEPLPDNECGHFTVYDPDGHELFFNTHPPERQPFEATMAGSAGNQGNAEGRHLLGRLVYCLEVTALDASVAFYESLGLVASREGRVTWITPPLRHRAVHFVLQLRAAATPGCALRFFGDVTDDVAWRARGFVAEGPGWVGVDPDGRRLELLPDSMLPA